MFYEEAEFLQIASKTKVTLWLIL